MGDTENELLTVGTNIFNRYSLELIPSADVALIKNDFDWPLIASENELALVCVTPFIVIVPLLSFKVGVKLKLVAPAFKTTA